MADKGGFFAKAVQKHAGRAKEKILQNLGKADKTTDEIFDEYVSNFKKQEANANKLQREIKNYIGCIRAMQQASKSLFDTINETYEQDWVGHDQLFIKSQALEMFWSDFNHKLSDQVMIPLNTYQNQFAEVRKRVDKRGRKLVDYDSCRHAYEALLSNTKKRDDAKIAKAKEQLDDARRLYEILNSELYDELPALYDSRIPFLVSNLQTVFTAEAVFHQELSKVHSELGEIMDDLAEENQKGTYNSRKLHSPSQLTTKGGTLVFNASRARLFQHLRGLRNPSFPDSPTRFDQETRQYEEIDFKKGEKREKDLTKVFNVAVPDRNGEISQASPESPGQQKLEHKDDLHLEQYEEVENPDQGDSQVKPGEVNETKRVEELYDIPVGATTDNLPPGVLYRVRSTYRYVAEDEDELSFEVGEIIQVTEYEDPEDQEEGWLVGMKESTGQKGLFPANFTRPI